MNRNLIWVNGARLEFRYDLLFDFLEHVELGLDIVKHSESERDWWAYRFAANFWSEWSPALAVRVLTMRTALVSNFDSICARVLEIPEHMRSGENLAEQLIEGFEPLLQVCRKSKIVVWSMYRKNYPLAREAYHRVQQITDLGAVLELPHMNHDRIEREAVVQTAEKAFRKAEAEMNRARKSKSKSAQRTSDLSKQSND